MGSMGWESNYWIWDTVFFPRVMGGLTVMATPLGLSTGYFGALLVPGLPASLLPTSFGNAHMLANAHVVARRGHQIFAISEVSGSGQFKEAPAFCNGNEFPLLTPEPMGLFCSAASVHIADADLVEAFDVFDQNGNGLIGRRTPVCAQVARSQGRPNNRRMQEDDSEN